MGVVVATVLLAVQIYTPLLPNIAFVIILMFVSKLKTTLLR